MKRFLLALITLAVLTAGTSAQAYSYGLCQLPSGAQYWIYSSVGSSVWEAGVCAIRGGSGAYIKETCFPYGKDRYGNVIYETSNGYSSVLADGYCAEI